MLLGCGSTHILVVRLLPCLWEHSLVISSMGKGKLAQQPCLSSCRWAFTYEKWRPHPHNDLYTQGPSSFMCNCPNHVPISSEQTNQPSLHRTRPRNNQDGLLFPQQHGGRGDTWSPLQELYTVLTHLQQQKAHRDCPGEEGAGRKGL